MGIKTLTLEQRVASLEQEVQTLAKALRMAAQDPSRKAQDITPTAGTHSVPVDLSAELTKRHIEHTQADVLHITKIMGQYELSAKEILDTLNKIAIANQRTPIRNLPAYCNNTFRYEHADRARGTP